MQITKIQKDFFMKEGYLVVEDIINQAEVEIYKDIYNNFLSGGIDTGKNRSDLGDGLGENKKTENITQIMWPSDFVPSLLDMTYHKNTLSIAKQILGDDIEMDFDMLINKAPHTNTETPWHQDAAYWINMPDKRAVSCWLALDEATKENGCMWYVPGSHLKELRPHRFAGKQGGALTCDATENEGIFIELQPGSCILHHGGTLHYSRGNSTDKNRKALIINFRPEKMIALEREQGFDHGRSGNAAERKVRNDAFNK